MDEHENFDVLFANAVCGVAGGGIFHAHFSHHSFSILRLCRNKNEHPSSVIFGTPVHVCSLASNTIWSVSKTAFRSIQSGKMDCCGWYVQLFFYWLWSVPLHLARNRHAKYAFMRFLSLGVFVALIRRNVTAPAPHSCLRFFCL